MAKISNRVRNTDKSTVTEKIQISVYVEEDEAEALKAIAIAQDISVNATVVKLIREYLKRPEHQVAVQAYRQFKKSLGK